MKKYLLIIFIVIVGIIGLAIWSSERKPSIKEELAKLDIYSEEELSFLEKEGFFYDIDSENLPDNKEQAAYLFKSPGLVEQNLNSSDESFEVLATKLNKSNKSYQLAFKLENKSNESKEFYLIPISEKDQLQFKEIKGLVNNTNLLSLDKGDARKEQLDKLYDVEQHKQELRTELGQAYRDIETNNYKAEPIKIILASKSTIIANSQWNIINESDDLKPVYFLVYGSAAGVKEELTILNVHSHPQQGENWEVEFTTRGMADLKIIPADQATIDDDEFVGLYCNGQERNPQILQRDVIYYPNWQCNGIGKVVHYTLTAGNHKLRFEFKDQISYAFNDPDAERQSPDAYVTQTNLDGTISDIQDDPDNSPDANWADAIDHGDDTVAHVSFPLPTGNLTTGADKQEFKIWIKKSRDKATTPECRIDLYENGAPVTSGTLTGVTSLTGELKSFTWDAENLSNVDGSSVEAYIYGAKAGAAAATNWVDPNGFNEGDWSAEASAYDGDTETSASYDHPGGDAWGVWLELNIDATTADRVRIWSGRESTNISLMQVEVFYNEIWNNIYNSDYVGDGAYNTFTIGSSEEVTALQVSYFNNHNTQARFAYVDELDFGEPVAETYSSVSVGAVEWNVDYTSNVDPAISAVKDGPDPIEVDQTITFYVDWTDGDSEGVKMLICKSDSINEASSPSCNGGQWCSNDGGYYLAPTLTCNYTITSGDTGTKAYYAFVCDNEPTCNDNGEPGTFTASAATSTSLKFDGGIKFEGGIIIK